MEDIKLYIDLFNDADYEIPSDAEVIDLKFFSGGSDAKIESDFIWEKMQEATRKGLNYVVVPKSYYDKVIEAHKRYENFCGLLAKTAELNTKGIELEKQGKIDEAIKVYEENIALGYKAFHSFDRLLVLYHKAEDYENEKRVIFRAREVYENDALYEKRLNKLNGTYVKPSNIFPVCANPIIVKNNSLGKQYEELKLKFPDFDFYTITENVNDRFMSSPYKNDIWEIHSIFGKKLSDAEDFEEQGDYQNAAKVYEELVSEEYYLTRPYDRLIKIYSRAKLKSAERNMLEYSIDFFKKYRDIQKEYILCLARKYQKEDIALEYIKNDKKIFYYNGAFELYNPNVKIINDWEKRLAKLSK